MSDFIEPYILDPNFNVVGVLDSYSSFIWTDRYDEAGDFELTLPATIQNLQLFGEDYYIYRSNSEHIMYVDMIETISDAETGSELKISGYSLEKILDRRIIWKQTRINGNLQNGVKALLNENVISPTDKNRIIPGFRFVPSSDPNITSVTVDAQFTGDSLYETIVALCRSADLGFKITMPQNGVYEFKLYSGANRTYGQDKNPYIIFSPYYENLMNSNSIRSYMNYKTVALIGGEGEGSKRKYATYNLSSGPGVGMSRRELFVDARDISSSVVDDTGHEVTLTEAQYMTELKNRGKEQLLQFLSIITFDGEAETSRSFEYKKDFYIGDIVQLEDEYQQTFTARITEYIYSYDEQSANEYPSFSIIQ